MLRRLPTLLIVLLLGWVIVNVESSFAQFSPGAGVSGAGCVGIFSDSRTPFNLHLEGPEIDTGLREIQLKKEQPMFRTTFRKYDRRWPDRRYRPMLDGLLTADGPTAAGRRRP